jgi:hypothetical protein
LIFFFPSVFELKRQKDKGSRRIMNIQSEGTTDKSKADFDIFNGLEDIEKRDFEKCLGCMKRLVYNPIFVLSNIEG